MTFDRPHLKGRPRPSARDAFSIQGNRLPPKHRCDDTRPYFWGFYGGAGGGRTRDTRIMRR